MSTTASNQKMRLIAAVLVVAAIVAAVTIWTATSSTPAEGDESPTGAHLEITDGGPTSPQFDTEPIANGTSPDGVPYTIAVAVDAAAGVICHEINYGESGSSACTKNEVPKAGEASILLPAYFSGEAILLALVAPDVASVSVRGDGSAAGTATAEANTTAGYRLAHAAVSAPPTAKATVSDGSLPPGAPNTIPVPQALTVTSYDESGNRVDRQAVGGVEPTP